MSNATQHFWIRSLPKGDPDLLFNEGGAVKMPKLTGLALRICADNGSCFTRQPTRERAEAVMDATRERADAKGLAMEIRPGTNGTYGVYVTAA